MINTNPWRSLVVRLKCFPPLSCLLPFAVPSSTRLVINSYDSSCDFFSPVPYLLPSIDKKYENSASLWTFPCPCRLGNRRCKTICVAFHAWHLEIENVEPVERRNGNFWIGTKPESIVGTFSRAKQGRRWMNDRVIAVRLETENLLSFSGWRNLTASRYLAALEIRSCELPESGNSVVYSQLSPLVASVFTSLVFAPRSAGPNIARSSNLATSFSSIGPRSHRKHDSSSREPCRFFRPSFSFVSSWRSRRRTRNRPSTKETMTTCSSQVRRVSD